MKSKEFSLKIEQLVKDLKLTHMEAVIHYCEENNIDPGTVGSLISKSLKEKIQVEATDKRLLSLPRCGVLPL
ncbi:late promoter transcription accessory protein [bacterium]|jgi:hypothetical protein|nr:late promoter transcription accessory protein [bacterium]